MAAPRTPRPEAGTISVAVLAASVLAGAAGCGTGPRDAAVPEIASPERSPPPAPDAARAFREALDSMARHDASGWSEAACRQVAESFLRVRDPAGRLPAAAAYDAGLAYQRCGLRADAKKQHVAVLSRAPAFHRARVQLALLAFEESGERAVEAAIAELKRAVVDARFQNVEALVHLARLQMRRGSAVSDGDGADDLERAKRNLQRALAIDDGYMPAFDQLALHYLAIARRRGGETAVRVARGAHTSTSDAGALELAALVCSQALQRDPRHAPVHNTAGLIAVERGDPTAAVQSFGRARTLDPTFFEAHMNFAAVNLQFRGFQQAESAYRRAMQLRPGDYDAHLGLALALRGQIEEAASDTRLGEVQRLLERAKQIDPDRPEAYFNDAVLAQSFGGRSGGADGQRALVRAAQLFRTFAVKARERPDLADAVADVTAVPTKPDAQCATAASRRDPGCRKGRIAEIEEILLFEQQTREEQRRFEQERKQVDVEDEAAGAGAPGG
jgi:tetratricopeptide (TPR) repeat protein